MIALILVAIGVLVFVKQDKFRGADSPGSLATAYVAAAVEGDVSRASWLMPNGDADAALVSAHVARFAGASAGAVSVEMVSHPVAAYLISARLSYGGVLIDTLVIQNIGSRWYLVHFAD